MRSFDTDWANFEWDQDDHMEELWEKGEAGEDFDSSPRIIEPDHFQCLFLIIGVIHSVGLVVLLWDILTAPPTIQPLDSVDPQSRKDQYDPNNQFYSLMLAGLSACLLFTLFNLFLSSTALWKPVTIDNGKGDIFTGEYEYDMEMLVNNKTVAFAILGYGAVTSFIFIFIAMMRSLGKNYLYEFFLNFCFINLIQV